MFAYAVTARLRKDFIIDPEDKRDYIIGAGFLIKSEIMLDHLKAGKISANYRHFTFDILSGPDGVERLHLLSFRYTIPVWLSHRLGVDYTRYFRRVRYFSNLDLQNVKKDLYEFRVFVGFEF